MRNPCRKCIVKAACKQVCTEKIKFRSLCDILIFFSVFLFITSSNFWVLKYVIPYIHEHYKYWVLLLFGGMCCYMSIAIRALFETFISIRDYWINYGRKKTTG